MREPDLYIGPRSKPQTLRWHLIRWRGWQLALHKWLRSDDDRALHDHSGHNISLILNGGYWELVRYKRIVVPTPMGVGAWIRRDTWHWRRPFVPYFRLAETPHRVALNTGAKPVWSLWLRWPPIREWGFHCPKGWRHWKDYCNTRDYSTQGSASEIGPGCD